MNDAGNGPIERKVAKIPGDDVRSLGSGCAFEDAVVVRVGGKGECCGGFDFPDGRLETGDEQVYSRLDRFELGPPEDIDVFCP